MAGINAQQTLNNAAQNLQNQSRKAHGKDGGMGKQDFMNLFMTQMSNQNPTDPMDSSGMMAQMAQMGSMEQLQNLNEGVASMNKSQATMINMQAMEYLNKDVMIDGSEMELSQGQPRALYYDLNQKADHVRVLVEGPDGMPIYKQDLGLVQPGNHRFTWNGKDDAGRQMADGKYNVRVIANHADGSSKELGIYNIARVTGVDFKNGEPRLNANGQSLPMNKITRVDSTLTGLMKEAKPLPMMKELRPMGLAGQ